MAERYVKKSELPLTQDQLAVQKAAETIERQLVFGMAKSLNFYRVARDLINPYNAEKQTYRKDFSVLRYNTFYSAIDAWWRIFDKKTYPRDRGFLPATLSAYLVDWCNRNKVLPAECAALTEEIAMEAGLMEEITYESSMALIQSEGFHYWLDQRATEHAAKSMQLDFSRGKLTVAQIVTIADRAKAMTSNHRSDNITDSDTVLFGKYNYGAALETGIKGLDLALGGGVRRGETTIFAAINGGGKTIAAMQFALAFISVGANVALATTERRPFELMLRIVSNAVNIEFSNLINRPDIQNAMSKDGGEFNLLPDWLWTDPGQAERMNRLRDMMQRHLRFIDWTKGVYTIEGNLDGEVRQLENQGFVPDVEIFDWLGGGLGKMDPREIRGMYINGANALIQRGKEYNRIVMMMAQFNKEKVKARTKMTTMDMLAEAKAITDKATNFIGVSSLRTEDPEGGKPRLDRKQFMTVDKATIGPGGMFPVEQVFKFQRFQSPVAGGLSVDV